MLWSASSRRICCWRLCGRRIMIRQHRQPMSEPIRTCADNSATHRTGCVALADSRTKACRCQWKANGWISPTPYLLRNQWPQTTRPNLRRFLTKTASRSPVAPARERVSGTERKQGKSNREISAWYGLKASFASTATTAEGRHTSRLPMWRCAGLRGVVCAR